MRGISLILLLISFSVQAEIYRWVDENGNVHFGDRANGMGAQQVEVDQYRNSVGRSDEAYDELSREEKRQRLLDAMTEDRAEREQQKAEDDSKKRYRKQRCAEMKDQMRRFRRAAALYDLDDEGNRVYQSNEKRKQTEARLQRAIDKHCR